MQSQNLYGKISCRGYYWFLAGVLVFYLLTAYQSSGFHHPDEHFQIIEFANYKLGNIKSADLAWEFNARIRPGLQPFLCFWLFKFCHLLGITDVYQLAFVLRAVTAVFAVWVIHRFVIATIPYIDEKYRKVYILLSFLLWFLPYINVRFSSETWSGLWFMLALATLPVRKEMNKKTAIIFGLLCGLSILFRYQSALMVLGAMLWLWIIAGMRFGKLLRTGISCLSVLIIGFFIDHWLYEGFPVTIYNYFHINIIEGVASNYGTAPWYKIIEYIISSPGPVGIFIFLSFVCLLVYKPRHLIVWVLLPFLLTHAIVPHKELRFLFPIAGLVPFVLILSWQEASGRFRSPAYKWIRLMVILIFVFTNMAGLIVVVSKGAGNTKVALTAYIHKHYVAEGRVNVLYIRGHNPYYDWIHPKNSFYNSREVLLTPIATVWQDNLFQKIKKGYKNLLVLSNEDITGPRTLALLKNLRFIRVFQTIPKIDGKIIRFYDQSINDDNLILYEYKR